MHAELATHSLLGLLLQRATSDDQNLGAVVELQEFEENDSVGNAYSLKYLFSEVHFESSLQIDLSNLDSAGMHQKQLVAIDIYARYRSPSHELKGMQARRLAASLQDCFVEKTYRERQPLIGIYLDRGATFIAACLACLLLR